MRTGRMFVKATQYYGAVHAIRTHQARIRIDLVVVFACLIVIANSSGTAQNCFSLPNTKIIYVDSYYQGTNPDGTFNAPFRTLADAYSAAKACDVIYVSSGTYHETMMLGKHIQLKAPGGQVVIGGMSGTFYGNDGAVYYLQVAGSQIWWLGESVDPGKTPLQVWHRGLDYSSVFHGIIGGNTFSGEWVDVCRGVSTSTGYLTGRIDKFVESSGNIRYNVALTSGNYHTSALTQGDAVDDYLYQYPNGTTSEMDFYQRVRTVHKNDDPVFGLEPYPETRLGDTHNPQNLRPYRDQTLFYGEISTRNSKDDQSPHVNYPVLTRATDFHSFVCLDPDDGDGDLDLRLHIFVNPFRGEFPSLSTDFPSLGWGNINAADQGESGNDAGDIIQKFLNLGLFEAGAADSERLPLPGQMAYLGIEGVMYGGDHGKSGLPGSTDCGTTTLNRLLPGWADVGGNSILVNGRPINGQLTVPSDQIQEQKHVNLRSLLGHPLHPFDTHDTSRPTEVRVTGALILDCGHYELDAEDPYYVAPSGITHCCYQNSGWDPAEPDENQNQEIHPIYSIDIIERPLGWYDSSDVAPSDIGGAWGSSDGGTYYLRQIGDTIWWLGLTRDRTPMIPVSAMTCDGCLKISDPTNVFKGTISANPDGSASITGEAIQIPRGFTIGGRSAMVTMRVTRNHKVIHLVSASSAIPLPTRLDKLWEP